MDSLVGYGSEDEIEERYGSHQHSSVSFSPYVLDKANFIWNPIVICIKVLIFELRILICILAWQENDIVGRWGLKRSRRRPTSPRRWHQLRRCEYGHEWGNYFINIRKQHLISLSELCKLLKIILQHLIKNRCFSII